MIAQQFETVFGHASQASRFTPGRVNLIGEHIDYNCGLVLPTALPLGVQLALAPGRAGRIRVSSDSFDTMATRQIDASAQDHWSDYIVGAARLARDEGFGPDGLDIAVSTDLPIGSGLSSSAAVTVGVLGTLRNLAGADFSDVEIAVLARQVENDFIGVPCGIMDQMAIALARPGEAIALDTATLSFERIALPETHRICVIHSGVARQLNEGRYKERAEQCDVVKAALGHDDICGIGDDGLASLAGLPDPLPARARHCVTEHRRTVKAVAALKAGDMLAFGRMMNASHESMRDDFEISVPAIDALVADAQALGALGARMTGGGFGGCIVACVESSKVPSWRETLLHNHPGAVWVC